MRQGLTFVYDYGQVYLCDASVVGTVDFLGALDDSTRTGLTVGVEGALVDLLLPFSVQLPSGRLLLEGSGGSGELEIEIPPGDYRARWSGRGFPPAGEYVPGESSPDSYRLQLWSAPPDDPPRELKRWPGYDLLSG